MQVIDIEAMRSPRRETPQISFRRTEADRRPARVVRRPNDGPTPEWHRQFHESAERAEKAKVMSDVTGATGNTLVMTAAALIERRQAEKVAMLRLLASDAGPYYVRNIVDVIGATEHRVGCYVRSLDSAGLIVRAKGQRKTLIITITDAGRAYLAGLGQ